MAISILYNPFPMRLFEADGDFAAGAKGYFYLARTTTPLTVYTDAPLAVPHTWPVIADAYGLFAPIYIRKGTEYKVRIEDSAGNILYAADSIDNPAAPTGGEGGSGGLVITASQIAQTGDFWWQPTTASRDGWVKSNGKTLSHPSGIGDTKNLDLQALFMFIWNGFQDSLCPVTPGGRGPNALADWQAFKSIATLDMRGYGAAGLDDMGAAAANRIQVSTSIGTTNTSTVATVPSILGLCAGMYVSSASVPTGATIASILSPTSIVLSHAATVTNVAAAVRFSIFGNAMLAGAAGGENVHVQSAMEIAAHTHPGGAHTHNIPNHRHAINYGSGAQNNAGIGFMRNIHVGSSVDFMQIDGGGPTDQGDSGNPTGSSGGGVATNLWTPTRLGTWFNKI